MMQSKLAVIDDEVGMSGLIANIASSSGFSVTQFNSSKAFKAEYANNLDVIILDLMMPEVDGIEIIRFLSESGCNAQLVLVSGLDSSVLRSAQKLAHEKGLKYAASLTKPFSNKELINILEGLSSSPAQVSYAMPSGAPPVEELIQAIKNNELVVYYQPQVSLGDRKIIGVEALVRWHHPEKGLLPPVMFIQTAEENNLIDDITWVVLEQAITHCKDYCSDDSMISINISGNTFWNLELPEHLESLAKKYGIECSQLVLELTETAMMADAAKSLDILTRLRMKNFQLSIDDFGIGYSSLAQLHRAPFSELKIDRSFVMDMAQDPEARAIVETIIMLGHKLGLKVIAEGIETQEAFDQLTFLGCDIGQGYFMAKPMPHAELSEWISNWNAQYLK